MTEQRLPGAYLGPGKGRWTPAGWSDVVEAAAGGLLDESHWVDLKQELSAGKRALNTELAQDLASLLSTVLSWLSEWRTTTAGPGRCAGSNWPSSLIAWIRLRATRSAHHWWSAATRSPTLPGISRARC